MNEQTNVADENIVKPWYRREILIFISGSLLVAFVLVVMGLALYVSSGADLLDLSRPGYKSVRGEVDQSGSFQSFPSSGPVNRETVDQFLKLYDKQVRPVINDDVFSASTLEDQTLGIDAPAAGE